MSYWVPITTKKNLKTYLPRTILQSLSKLAIWNRDRRKLKYIISQLLNGVESSITTLKCSEDSHYGVWIRVSKSSDFPFPRYGPRPFFGPAILAENWKICILSNLFKWDVVSYVYSCQKSIATVCLRKWQKEMTFCMKKWHDLEDFEVSRYLKIVTASYYITLY